MGKLQVGDVIIDVEKKNIKNINLRVYPPYGRVYISAPHKVKQDAIRAFAFSKLEWIRKQQLKLRSQVRELPDEFIEGECHYFNGNPYSLQVIEKDAPPAVEINQQTLILGVRPDTPADKRQKLLDEWYRAHLRRVLPGLIEKWEGRMQVKVNEFGIKKMKTRWGTCNRKARRIWLNLELAKKPPECLEYVVVHELAHLLERNHNKHFYSLLDEFYAGWKIHKAVLNKTPIKK